MANELLDFVISLVRDPDAAARYAADPGRAIADAHLTGVTSADVNNLLPMVSDSLSMAAPAHRCRRCACDGNVWTSGAATAAFDAFTPHATPNEAVDPPSDAGRVDRTLPTDAAAERHDEVSAFDGFDTSTQFGGSEVAAPDVRRRCAGRRTTDAGTPTTMPGARGSTGITEPTPAIPASRSTTSRSELRKQCDIPRWNPSAPDHPLIP